MKALALAAALAGLVLAAPSSAIVPDPAKQEAIVPCSVRACAVARLVLDPGETATVVTRRRFGVWHRTQDLLGRVNGGRRDVLAGVEAIDCGAWFYGRGLVVRATMPRCQDKRRSRIELRVTNGRPDRVSLRLLVLDEPATAR